MRLEKNIELIMNNDELDIINNALSLLSALTGVMYDEGCEELSCLHVDGDEVTYTFHELSEIASTLGNISNCCEIYID